MIREGSHVHFNNDKAAVPLAAAPEEALVSDARSGLTPADMVERKLVSLLQSAPLPVSRLRQTPPLRRVLS
jgi:hypothetical protein